MQKKYPKPVGPYSPAKKVGNLLFCSGQIGLNPESMKIVDGGVEEETKQVMQNILGLLEDYKLSMQDVVKTTVLLDDIGDFAKINTIYAQFFKNSKPARSCFAVKALPLGAKIEIEVIAEYI